MIPFDGEVDCNLLSTGIEYVKMRLNFVLLDAQTGHLLRESSQASVVSSTVLSAGTSIKLHDDVLGIVVIYFLIA